MLVGKVDYDAKVYQILANTNRTEDREKPMPDILEKLENFNNNTQISFGRLNPTGSNIPRTYGLLKMHKSPHQKILNPPKTEL